MKQSLRRRLSLHLALSAIIAAFTASVGLWVFGEYYFRVYYASMERAGLENVRGRLDLFDLIMARAEEDVVEPGRRALLALSERYASAQEIATLGSGALKAAADELGVGEVYFVGKDGTVFASSLPGDIGLNLFALGPRFSASLERLYGKGVVGNQRLTQSTASGIPSVYQYFGPIDRDYLIEVSTPIGGHVSRLYGEFGYNGLVALAFGTGGDGRFVRLVDLIGEAGGALWSFTEIGRKRSEYADLVAAARSGLSARRSMGGIETALMPVSLDYRNTAVVHDRRFAVVEIDRRPLLRYRGFTLLMLVASCGAAIVVSFVVADRNFARTVASRVERLEGAIGRSADSALPFDFSDSCDDEIASIGRSVASLVRQVRRRAEDREALNARLSAELERGGEREQELALALAEQTVLRREVHHRVKNNMQIVLSLIGLQAEAPKSGAEKGALEAMRTRMYAMSLVLDRLYAREDVERLPLDEFLRDFVFYLDGIHRRSDFFATVRSEGNGLFLAADAAVPVALIVGELVSNSLLHAFPGRATGSVEVSAVRGNAGEDAADASGAGFTLTVRDDGAGGDPAAQGIGLTIVRALAAQLGASLDVELSGGRATRIRVPGGLADPPRSDYSLN